MWAKIVWWLRFVVVLWVAAIGIGAALQALGIFPQLPKATPYVWVISLVFLGVDNLGTLISRKVQSNRRRTLGEIEQALMAILIQTANTTNVLFQDLGASVYIVTAHWWQRGPKTRLKRIKRFRPAGYPQQSGISWTNATGAVGECMRTRRTVHRDWQKVAEKYGDVELTEEQFAKLSDQTRHGFTCEQFNAISGKYSEVLAVPIWHGRKEREFIGVLTIDRAYKGQDDTFMPKLLGTRDSASSAASAVSRSLMPSSSDAN